jgi:DNA polymerase III alpha subunit
VLRETDGVPFFQEQMVSMIRVLASCSRRIAEALFRDLRVPPGPRLARERSLFVRRAVDRGLDPATANRVFSLLLALAPHAPRRGEVLPYARRVLRAAGRKAADPAGFAAAALNAALDDRKRMHLLWAGFRREGIRFLPLDRNASEHLFRVEGGSLRAGFGSLAGVTQEIGNAIVEERERGGAFASEADLLRRLAALGIPRTALEEAARALSRAIPAEPVSGVGAREGGARPIGSAGPSRAGGRHAPRAGARGRRGREQTSFSFLKGGEGGSIDGRLRRPLSENREEK